MKVREWRKLNLPIEWGIFQCSDQEKDDLPYEDWDVNLDMSIPDGEYKVRDVLSDDILISGVTIKNGKFVPRPTSIAIYEAVRHNWANIVRDADGNIIGEEPMKSFEEGGSLGYSRGLPHFVEKIEWNGSHFVVSTGH